MIKNRLVNIGILTCASCIVIGILYIVVMLNRMTISGNSDLTGNVRLTPRIPIVHHLESFYQKKFCEIIDGQREKQVSLGRIDVETSNAVFEVEFLNKFKEAIGQCTWYAWTTGKRPGVVFIVRNDQTNKYNEVLDTITNHSGIIVFAMDADGNLLQGAK